MKVLFLFISLFVFWPSFVQAEDSFKEWKQKFISKHQGETLPENFLEQALESIKYRDDIIEKDRNQLTSSSELDYSKWIQKWLKKDPSRIEKGRELLQEHRELLDQVEKKYGVPKEVIVSLWGVETYYGKITGEYSIIEALATLSFDKRRSRFFEKELLAALKILRQGHVSSDDFLASWAGATGQCQFMPTSFMAYAQDFDGDGKKNIWTNKADVFASIAYYLKKAGWKKGGTIGTLAKKTKDQSFKYDRFRTANQYNRLGLRRLDGSKLKGTWRRRVESMPQKNSPLILPGSNYKVLMRWNRSSLFAALNIILVEAFQSK